MIDRPSDPELDDQTIEQLLSRLKQLEPPLESRIANRAAVASEITRMTEQCRARTLPVWRRTIAIPWPLAAAVFVMLVTLSLMSFRSNRHVAQVVDTPDTTQEDGGAVVQRIQNEVTRAINTPTLAYYETATYLCGIGQLRYETKYVLEE